MLELTIVHHEQPQSHIFKLKLFGAVFAIGLSTASQQKSKLLRIIFGIEESVYKRTPHPVPCACLSLTVSWEIGSLPPRAKGLATKPS